MWLSLLNASCLHGLVKILQYSKSTSIFVKLIFKGMEMSVSMLTSYLYDKILGLVDCEKHCQQKLLKGLQLLYKFDSLNCV